MNNLRSLSACLIVLIIILLSYNHELHSQMLYSGEKLNYRVSYLGITLGYITISTDEKLVKHGNDMFKTKGYMKSNPDIPFVNLQAVYESWIDTSAAFSHEFIGKVRIEDGTWDYHHIIFNYAKKKIRSQKFIHKEIFFDSTFYTDKKGNDGLSLFFLARKFTKLGKTMKTLTIVDRDTVFTVINFVNKKTVSEIDAVDYKIKTIYFNGKADWTGIYGITGEFEGWFSDDEASIPIVAKMKVYIGSVRIELVEWKRGNWQPPKID